MPHQLFQSTNCTKTMQCTCFRRRGNTLDEHTHIKRKWDVSLRWHICYGERFLYKGYHTSKALALNYTTNPNNTYVVYADK